MKKINFFTFLLLSLFVWGQEPSGYYDNAENKNSAALKTALSSIISANYKDNGYDGLYNIYKTSDNLPNGKVWDMYSLKADGTANYYFSHTSDKCGSYSGEGNCYNREHTFCDSWLGAASPQRSDAHHLIPTDGYVNNRRGSYPHGKVGSATWTSSNGSKLGSSDASTGYSGTVFEPIDEFKGDFARMYFYVATRYESKIAGWANNGSANAVLNGTSYPAYKPWFYNLMLAWHRQDPVSQKEIDRNNAIYTYQKNRNPFIDHPELAEYIWGNKTGTAWTLNPSTDPVLTSPASGSVLDFGTVSYRQNTLQTISISGSNLTGDLTVIIGGTDAGCFSIPASIISKADAQTGYSLAVTYNAPQTGTHSATLTISGGGISTATVNIIGNAVSCQNLDFSSSFASTIDPFTQYSITGTQIWTWRNADYGVAISGYSNPNNYENEDWLLSPSLDLSNYEGVVLSFEHTINKGIVANMQTENTVFVSNDYVGGNPQTATWIPLNIPTYPAGNDWDFVGSGNIEIPVSHCLSNTVIGFKYLCTNTASSTWEIKNLKTTGTCKSTPVHNATLDKKHSIYSKNGEINISDMKNEDTAIFDVFGKKVFSEKNISGSKSIKISHPGIYIVKIGNERQKIIIR
ncbi:MAG: endonuclease [Paludibacteraceae bacterium]